MIKTKNKLPRKTVRIVVDSYLQSIINSRKTTNAMLEDAEIVKILLGEKVTEEIKKEQNEAKKELLNLIKKVKTPKIFNNMSPDEQDSFIENNLN